MGECCRDCLYYLPVDVFKGICKLEKKTLTPDDASCGKFERQPKCKFCANFNPEKEFLGTCLGTRMTYPDLNAAKCIDFEWAQLN
jgi:hypothetical protein